MNKRSNGDRFAAKVDQHGPISDLVGTRCWLWTASTRDGYGQFWLPPTPIPAHRFAYEMHVGPIPDGLDIDHLCRVRHCVNPSHLEPVTRRENVIRGLPFSAIRGDTTRCFRDHELSGDNLLVWNDGRRRCRTCEVDRRRRRRAANPKEKVA